MNAENFTTMLVEAFNEAKKYCESHGYQEITPAIIAKILIDQRDGLVGAMVRSLGPPGQALVREIDQAVSTSPRQSQVSNVYLSPSLSDAINKADRFKKLFNDEYLSTDTFFLGLCESPSLANALKQARLDID